MSERGVSSEILTDLEARVENDEDLFSVVLFLIQEGELDEAKKELTTWYDIQEYNGEPMVVLNTGNQYFTILCNILMLEEFKRSRG